MCLGFAGLGPGWLEAPGGPPGLPSHLGKVNKRGPACACVVDYSMYSHNHGQANLSRNQNSASKLQTHACSSSTSGDIETRAINDGGDGLRWLLFFRWSRAASCETVRYIGLGSSSRCTPAAHPPSGAVARRCNFKTVQHIPPKLTEVAGLRSASIGYHLHTRGMNCWGQASM